MSNVELVDTMYFFKIRKIQTHNDRNIKFLARNDFDV